MKTTVITIILFIFAFSCTNLERNRQSKFTQAELDSLNHKYETMYTSSEDCKVCLDCSLLTMAIKYDLKDQIKEYEDALLKYYNKNNEIPCPEILEIVNKKQLGKLNKSQEKSINIKIDN